MRAIHIRARWIGLLCVAAVAFVGALVLLGLLGFFELLSEHPDFPFGQIFAAYALIPRSEVDSFTVRKTFFWIAFGLSIFYFIILVAVVAAAPFSAASRAGTHPIDVMHRSNFFLGPLQGLTAAALGALFFSKSKE